jgi:hypothetical protein
MALVTSVKSCTRTDTIRKDETCLRRELEIYSIEDKLKEYGARWSKHMGRIGDTRIMKQAFHYTQGRRRYITRSRKR